jgi:hypothetical protein
MAKANDSLRDFDPPAGIPADASVLDYLLACRAHRGTQPLELRVIKSMLRKARVPQELEEDAAQDIRVAWALNKVKRGYEPEQVLKYAYSIALRAALHTRREIQNVARLPGNGYRKRADGTRYAPDSILARAFSWEDMERYHRTDDGQDDEPAGRETPTEGEDLPTDHNSLTVEHGESSLENERLQLFEQYACRLTATQAQILRDLASGMGIREIHARLQISHVRLVREISISSSVLGVDISKIELKQK